MLFLVLHYGCFLDDCSLDGWMLLMFKKFVVADQFYNEIAVQFKIPIRIDFYERKSFT